MVSAPSSPTLIAQDWWHPQAVAVILLRALNWALVIGPGNPRVEEGYPYPYPAKPIPVLKGSHGYKSGVLGVDGYWLTGIVQFVLRVRVHQKKSYCNDLEMVLYIQRLISLDVTTIPVHLPSASYRRCHCRHRIAIVDIVSRPSRRRVRVVIIASKLLLPLVIVSLSPLVPPLSSSSCHCHCCCGDSVDVITAVTSCGSWKAWCSRAAQTSWAA